MKYLLIDGNNLAIRSAFANSELTNSEHTPTGVHYGVFQSLINLKMKYPDYQFLLVWDGKSKRRVEEALDGVSKGLVPSGYKENRDRGDEMPMPLQNFYIQSDNLKKGIDKLGIPQIRIREFEADDVIASYAKMLRDRHKVTIVTSDRDYWQILADNVEIWDGMKMSVTTKDSWEKEYGMPAIRAIDMGALCGDAGDNIFGIPSWGDKTALKELKKHGSWEEVLKSYHEKHDDLRKKYPDLNTVDGGEDKFKIISEIKSNPKNPNSRLKFPQIQFDMPFTGVCAAFNDEEIKIPKTELLALMFEDRIKLAYSLKKMDDDIEDLPEIQPTTFDQEKVLQYLDYFDIDTLTTDIEIFKDQLAELVY